MQFPERPTCHDVDSMAQRFAAPHRDPSWPDGMPSSSDERGYVWHQAGHREETYEQAEGSDEFRQTGEIWIGYPWRECGYCGSINPQDLLAVLVAGARLGGSDWKYGWPHKFYVEGIANPEPERLYKVSSSHQNGRTTSVKYGTRPVLHSKWYNNHISDEGFDEEARAALIAALHRHAGIEFFFDHQGRLMYRAPHAGYQA